MEAEHETVVHFAKDKLFFIAEVSRKVINKVN
jgi:hypothetical protein